MHAKFDHSSFNRSRDMVVAHQNVNGLRDLTTPLSGIVCHPWASTCYHQPIYQILSPCLYPLQRYKKRYKMSKIGWFGVVLRGHSRFQGHWKWRHSIEHTRVPNFLLAFHSNYVPILHRFQDIARYWSKIADLNIPTFIWRPRWGWPRLNFAEIFGVRKLESMGYRMELFARFYV